MITGTSSGLGQALFRQLSGKVCLIALSRRFTAEQQSAAKSQPEQYQLIDMDLARQGSVKAVLERLDRLDWAPTTEFVFINNASVVEPQDLIGRLEEQGIMFSFQVNLLTPAMITNYLEQKRQVVPFRLKLVNVTSRAAVKPTAGWSLYCAGKAGAHAFFENYRVQMQAEPSVEVYSFDPGLMDSPMQERIRSASPRALPDVARFVQYQQKGALQAPDKVAVRLIEECRILCA